MKYVLRTSDGSVSDQESSDEKEFLLSQSYQAHGGWTNRPL